MSMLNKAPQGYEATSTAESFKLMWAVSALNAMDAYYKVGNFWAPGLEGNF